MMWRLAHVRGAEAGGGSAWGSTVAHSGLWQAQHKAEASGWLTRGGGRWQANAGQSQWNLGQRR
jgi:hypothetical protein